MFVACFCFLTLFSKVVFFKHFFMAKILLTECSFLDNRTKKNNFSQYWWRWCWLGCSVPSIGIWNFRYFCFKWCVMLQLARVISRISGFFFLMYVPNSKNLCPNAYYWKGLRFVAPSSKTGLSSMISWSGQPDFSSMFPWNGQSEVSSMFPWNGQPDVNLLNVPLQWAAWR